MALKEFRQFISSRWLLVPAALVIGAAAGASLTLVYAQRRLTEQLPFHAALSADMLAQMDRGNAAAAHELLKGDLESTLHAVAVNAKIWRVDLNGKSREFRNVSTYLSRNPSVQLTPEAAQMIIAFAPFTDAELASGSCRSGICELARSTPAQAATRPSGKP